MKIKNRLSIIRVVVEANSKQKFLSVIFSATIGIILGLLAKLADNPDVHPLFHHVFSHLGIWIFFTIILSVFSYSPRLAVVKTFAFFCSLLTSYYLYTIFVLNFFPQKIIIFWYLLAFVPSIYSHLGWHAHGKGLISNLIIALPVAVLLSEVFEFRNAYLPFHTYYYVIYWYWIIYLIMIIILLFIIPKNGKQFIIIFPIAILFSIIIIRLNIFALVFGERFVWPDV